MALRYLTVDPSTFSVRIFHVASRARRPSVSLSLYRHYITDALPVLPLERLLRLRYFHRNAREKEIDYHRDGGWLVVSSSTW